MTDLNGDWGTEETTAYSPDKFYTDMDGSGERVSVRLSPQDLHRIDAFIASKQVTAYTTRSEFIRDAVAHRLHYIHKEITHNEYEIKEMEVDMTISQTNQHIRSIERAEKLLHDTRRLLERATRRQDWTLVELAIDGAHYHMDAMREPYLTEMSQLLEKYAIGRESGEWPSS